MTEAPATQVARLPRARRREQIVAAATEAFARAGYAATSLDDIAIEAGVSRVILYRHFESKAELYEAVLDRVGDVLAAHVNERVGGYTEASLDGFVDAAAAEPAGFRLLFQHAGREAEFRERADRFRADITEAAYVQISALVPNPSWARWASQLAPAVAIEAIIAWLDAGRPDPDMAAERIRQVVGCVIGSVTRGGSGADC